MAQTTLPWELSGSRESTITILVSILKSSPIASMVKARLVEISKAERTKFVKEVIKESSPMKMPELFIENWPRRGHDGSWVGIKVLGVNDTPVFLLNEYIVELNPANFNILNKILN